MKKAIFWDSDGTLLYGNESLVHNMQAGKVCCEQLTDLFEKIIE